MKRTFPLFLLTAILTGQALAAPSLDTVKEQLSDAIDSNNVALAKKLMATPGLDINAPLPSYHSRPALVSAAAQGRTAIFKAILAMPNVNPNVADEDGDTAVGAVASDKSRLEMLRLLVANPKVELNSPDSYGDSALTGAAHSDNVEGVKLLLATPRIKITQKNTIGQTALHRAALLGSSAIIRLLQATDKFDVNARTKYGDTALHYAASEGDVPAIKSLLSDPKIDPNIKNSAGETPLMLAEKTDIRYVQALLTSKKIKVTASDRKAIAKLKKMGGRPPVVNEAG